MGEKKELSVNEIKAIRLELLKEFHSICEKNHLRYSLAYGSLLGAVRHKGIIPWDYDIDVMMPRVDFDQLMLLHDRVSSERYRIMNNSICPELHTRIGNLIDYSTIETYDDYPKETNENRGINIDIYPIDVVPSDQNNKKVLLHKKKVLVLAFLAATSHPKLHRNIMTRIVLSIGKVLCRLYGINRIVSKIEKLSIQWKDCPIDESTQVGFIGSIEPLQTFPIHVMNSYCKYEFEGELFYGVCDYHSCLTAWYGNDYMTPPPIAERNTSESRRTHFFYK